MNLPKAITVEVTEEDITYGLKKNCDYCPIARAVKRVLPKYHCRATHGYISIYPNESMDAIATYYYEMPSEYGIVYNTIPDRFIDDFDAGRPVEPFTFTAYCFFRK